MARTSKSKETVDYYLHYALIIDAFVVVLIWVLNLKYPIFTIVASPSEELLKIVSSSIGASISLAGFILASLTIIVAIRSNILNKTPEAAKTPLELFFSIGTYRTIVKVFKLAIVELVFVFIVSFIVLTLSPYFSGEVLFNIVISLIFLMSVSTVRSLFVLFLLVSVSE